MSIRPLLSIICCAIFSISAAPQNQIPNDTTVMVNHDDTSAVFRQVEFEASFPGGQVEWRKFLERNLRGDVAIEHGAPAGIYTTVMQFIVDKDGNISDIKSLTDLGYGMEEEVMRILKKSPKWSPAIQDGKPVKAYRKQPVTFVIETDGFRITTEEPFVLYSGVENHINIAAGKVKPEDLEITISQGSISPRGNGNYSVRVAKPGRVIITLFNKKHKEIGAASFEVRQTTRSATTPALKG